MIEPVSIADYSEFLLSKLEKDEEGLYYRRIPEPARLGLLIVAASYLLVGINTLMMGQYWEIDLTFHGLLILGFGLAGLFGWWWLGYREILVTRSRLLITSITPGAKSCSEIPLSSIEEISLRTKSNIALLAFVVLFTGPIVIPLCFLYWKSRRIVVRTNIEYAVPFRGGAAKKVVADLQQVLDGAKSEGLNNPDTPP